MGSTSKAKELASRFEGAQGKARLVQALKQQKLFAGSELAIERVAKKSTIEGYEPATSLIAQRDTNTDIFFILIGTVIVSPNGRPDRERHSGNHIGEMAAIDPLVVRSADVIAKDDVVVARLTEKQFSKIADRHPKIWRNLACELGQRLRERTQQVSVRNINPRIFVGSSSEGLGFAKSIEKHLRKKYADVYLWTEGVFLPGGTNIEALEREAARSDFAVLILSPDDKVFSRKKASAAPRDNLIFELGLFMGATNRHRALFVTPAKSKIKLPSDLDGMTNIRYKPGKLDTAFHAIEEVIDRLGSM